MLLYFAVFAIGIAGLLQAPWWASVVGGCVLALMFISEDRLSSVNGVAAATQKWEIAQTTSSLIIAIVSSPIAFGAGRITATVWGL